MNAPQKLDRKKSNFWGVALFSVYSAKVSILTILTILTTCLYNCIASLENWMSPTLTIARNNRKKLG